MHVKWFYSIWKAESEEETEGGLGKWFWLLVILALEMLLIRWITEMQREARRRARTADQARRVRQEGQVEAPIREVAEPLPEPEKEDMVEAPIQEAAEPLPEPEVDQVDDFSRLEGIGAKVNRLLHGEGIRTYEQLAGSSEDRLRAILREANLYMINPQSWPEQAELAARGAWEQLDRLKGRLRAGRRT